MEKTCPLSAFFISSAASLGRVVSSPGRSPTSAEWGRIEGGGWDGKTAQEKLKERAA
jgi:hypothetical protein